MHYCIRSDCSIRRCRRLAEQGQFPNEQYPGRPILTVRLGLSRLRRGPHIEIRQPPLCVLR